MCFITELGNSEPRLMTTIIWWQLLPLTKKNLLTDQVFVGDSVIFLQPITYSDDNKNVSILVRILRAAYHFKVKTIRVSFPQVKLCMRLRRNQ